MGYIYIYTYIDDNDNNNDSDTDSNNDSNKYWWCQYHGTSPKLIMSISMWSSVGL